MRRFIISFISIILLYVLQSTIFTTYFSIAGITPNLILMFSCIVGFMRGRRSGMFIGFFGGMLVDIMNGGIIGLTPLMYLFIGYFNGLFYKEYSKEQLLLPIGLVALSDFAYGFTFYFFNFLFRNRLNLGFYFSRIIIPEIVYTVVVTIFAYILVYLINRQLDYFDRKRTARNVLRDNS